MTKNQMERNGLFISIAGMLVLAALVAARLVYWMGDGRNLSSWKDSFNDAASVVVRGQMVLQQDRWVAWNPPEIKGLRKPVFDIHLRCRWIGQIFFSVGDSETYLIFDDVREFVPDRPFSIRLSIEDDRLSLRLLNTDTVIRQTSIASGMRTGLTIRSSQSDFRIESILCRDGVTGSVAARETFGPDFKASRVLPIALLFVLAFLVLQWIDSVLWSKFVHQDKKVLRFTFLSSLLPLAFSYLLLDRTSVENLFDNFILAAIAFRIFLVFSVGRGKKKLFSDRRGWLWMAAGLGPGIFLLAALAIRGDLLHLPAGIILGSLILIGATFFLVWLFQRNRRVETLNPLRLCAQIWAFPAAGNLVLLFQDDEDPAAHLFYFFLFALTILALRFILHVRKNLRFVQPVAFALAVLVVAAAEGTLRHSPYATRFRPMNIGVDFEQNELLFWAPKDLFARATPHQPVDDFQVRKVRFRSGDTSVEKPVGTYRILTLGGSNTWGQWLDDPEKSWSGQLEAELSRCLPTRRFEVINAGVKGYNSFQLFVLYRKFLVDYDPDLIVLYININDRAAHERKGMYTYRELYGLRRDGNWDDILSKAGLKKRTARIRWVADAQRFFQRSSLYNAMTKALLSFRGTPIGQMIDPMVAKSLNPLDDYKANLLDFIRNAGAQGAQLVLADEFTFFGDEMEKKADPFQQAMREVAESSGALYFPAHDYLADHFRRSTLVFPWDPVHLNEKGHQALAEGFADFIQEAVFPLESHAP